MSARPGANEVDENFDIILTALARERLQVTLENKVKQALTAAQAPYSFWRLKGLQDLGEQLRWATASDERLHALRQGCQHHWPAVVEWLASTLSSPPASTQALVSPSSAGRDVSEVEQLGALKVLQAVCLVHPGSKELAGRAGLVEALAGSLQRLHGEEGLCGCLDALLTTMLECESTQARFVQLQGVERVCELLGAPDTAASVRRRCAEFLNLLVTQVLPEGPPVDLRRRAERSLQSQLGPPAAEVLLQPMDWERQGGSRTAFEGQLEDVAAATLQHLAAH